MTWRPFAVAILLPVLFTALVSIEVLRNRRGGRAAIELSEREVTLNTGTEDNSGATAWLTWADDAPRDAWLSRTQLAALGFDVSVDPASPEADRAYARQLQRRAYVVLRLAADGRARSRLVPVDAGLDPDPLLARYPDGSTHIVTAGVIGIRKSGFGRQPPFVDGYLANIDPRGIHVPSELGGRLPREAQRSRAFTVTVRYGSRLEPWIVDVR